MFKGFKSKGLELKLPSCQHEHRETMMLVTIGSSIDNIKPKDIQGIEESKHNLGRKII